MSKPNLNIKIDIDSRNPNNIYITDNTNYPPLGILASDVRINVKIRIPIGLLYVKTYYSTPSLGHDILGGQKFDYAQKEGASAVTDFMFDSNGCIIKGNYEVMLLWHNVSTNDTYEYTYSVNINDNLPSIKISHSSECLCATFTSNDTTNYEGTEEHSYQHTIQLPQATQEPNIDTSLKSYKDERLANGAYTTVVETDRTYPIGGVFSIRAVQKGSFSSIVDCSSICDIKCGINKLYDKYKELCGENKAEADKMLAKLNKISVLYAMMSIGGTCGDSNSSSSAVTEIKSILGDCNCDCGCSDCDDDVWVSNLCGSTGGSSFDPTPIYNYINSLISTINNLIVGIEGDIDALEILINQLINSSWFDGINLACVNANGFPSAGSEVAKRQWIIDFICGIYSLNLSCISTSGTLFDKLQVLINKVCELYNEPPVAITDLATTTQDTCVIIDIVGNDNIQHPPYTIAISTPPINGTAVLLPNNKIQYCPNAGFVGVDVLQYTITDSNGNTSSANVIITTVAATNTGCIAPTPSFTASANRFGSVVNVLLQNTTNWNGGCPNTTTYTITIKNSAGNIMHQQSYSGNNNNALQSIAIPFMVGMATMEVVMYVAPKDCGDGSPCSEISLLQGGYLIGNLNNAPIANDDFYGTDIDTPLVVSNILSGVLNNDSDPDGDTISVVAGTFTTVGGGTIVLNSNGTFTYTPLLGYSGTDSYTYTVQDSQGATDTATIYIEVQVGAGGADINLVINDLQLCGEPSTNGKITYILDASLTGSDADSIIGIQTIEVSTPTDPTQTLNYTPPKVLNGGFNLAAGLKADIMAGDGTIMFIVVAKDTSNVVHYYQVTAAMPAIQFTNDCFTAIPTNVIEFDPFA